MCDRLSGNGVDGGVARHLGHDPLLTPDVDKGTCLEVRKELGSLPDSNVPDRTASEEYARAR